MTEVVKEEDYDEEVAKKREERRKTAEKAYTVNAMMGEKMEMMITDVHTRLVDIDIRRAEVVAEEGAAGGEEAEEGHGKESKTGKVPVLLYLPPFFRDDNNEHFSCPPLNDDAAQLLASNHYADPLAETPKSWSKDEKRRLLDAGTTKIVDTVTAAWREKLDNVTPLIDQLTRRDPTAPKKRGRKSKADLALTPLDQQQTEQLKHLCDVRDECNEHLERTTYSEEMEAQLDPALLNNVMCEIAVTVFKGTRSSRECLLMWKNGVRPGVNSSSEWTDQELDMLERRGPSAVGADWERLAAKMGTGRTAFDCFRMHKSRQRRKRKSRVNDDDDEEDDE